MYKIIFLLIALAGFTISSSKAQQTYDPAMVEVSTSSYRGYSYNVIYMNRGLSGKRIKAKYFAAKDPHNGRAVPDRYSSWASDKNVICVTSGTYMDSPIDPKPVGLTIDNGVIVNESLHNDMDGLVIVYATGGVVASNLEDKDLTVQGGSISGIELDLYNSFHKTSFVKWCEQKEATVFQTHLLIYKDDMKVSSWNSNPQKRERRFLAVGNDEDGNLVHCVINSPEFTTLYEGTKRVKQFLNEFKEMEVIFMINLDTGWQDVFRLYDEYGALNTIIQGPLPIEKAVNLLVYYYE